MCSPSLKAVVSETPKPVTIFENRGRSHAPENNAASICSMSRQKSAISPVKGEKRFCIAALFLHRYVGGPLVAQDLSKTWSGSEVSSPRKFSLRTSTILISKICHLRKHPARIYDGTTKFHAWSP